MIAVKSKENKNKSILNVWNHFATPETKDNTLKALKIGQGLLSTKWKGWLKWLVILRNFSRVKSSKNSKYVRLNYCYCSF